MGQTGRKEEKWAIHDRKNARDSLVKIMAFTVDEHGFLLLVGAHWRERIAGTAVVVARGAFRAEVPSFNISRFKTTGQVTRGLLHPHLVGTPVYTRCFSLQFCSSPRKTLLRPDCQEENGNHSRRGRFSGASNHRRTAYQLTSSPAEAVPLLFLRKTMIVSFHRQENTKKYSCSK